ncbi:MAG: shikimate dehydrogenase, partial [Pseudomonadota bacterium]
MTDESPHLAAVIGWPVGHSRSPLVHGHWLRRHGIAGYYIPIGLRP